MKSNEIDTDFVAEMNAPMATPARSDHAILKRRGRGAQYDAPRRRSGQLVGAPTRHVRFDPWRWAGARSRIG